MRVIATFAVELLEGMVTVAAQRHRATQLLERVQQPRSLDAEAVLSMILRGSGVTAVIERHCTRYTSDVVFRLPGKAELRYVDALDERILEDDRRLDAALEVLQRLASDAIGLMTVVAPPYAGSA
jgi:hypothetical protein